LDYVNKGFTGKAVRTAVATHKIFLSKVLSFFDKLKKGRGKQHNPEVTDVFLRLLEKKPELWNK
jgi:hypothetical protein